MIQLADDDWAFIPGPPEIPDAPASSTDLREIAMYPPEMIAQAFLAYPGFSLLQDADPSWWQWRVRWERGASFLFVGMTLFETDPIAWDSSEISGCCELGEILALWGVLPRSLPCHLAAQQRV